MKYPALAALALSAAIAPAQPLTTSFTFQGRLDAAGSPATGTYDLRFTLFDAPTAGTQLGPQLCVDNVSVTNGLVTVQLDFGSQFAGNQRFLEVQARQGTGLSCSDGTGFTTLSPRQNLTSAPDAIFSLNAAAAATATNASSLNNQPPSFYTNAANLIGTLPSASLLGVYTGQLNLTNSSNSFTGNGAGLTQLNAANLATGTLPDARLSSNVPLLGGFNTFTGVNQFNGFTGVNRSSSLTGNEVFGLQNVPGGLGFAGMYIRSTDNSLGKPFYGYNVNGRSAWTYYDPAGNWRLFCGGVDAVAVTNTADVGIGTTTPAAKLDVNGAIRSTGLVFPDGSVQYHAAGLGNPDTPMITSGLPAGSTFVATLNGTNATLFGSYAVTRAMVLSGGQYIPGAYSMSSGITFRRPRTTDGTWAGWVTSPNVAMSMVLTTSGSTVTWSSSTILVELRLVPQNGVMYEEAELFPSSGVNISRIVNGAPAVNAPSSDSPGLTFNLNGSPVANAVGFLGTGGLVAPYDQSTGQITGARSGATIQVRCNPFSGADLRANFTGTPGQSGTILTSGTTWRAASHCNASRYTLRLADDGLPIEEYTVQLDPS